MGIGQRPVAVAGGQHGPVRLFEHDLVLPGPGAQEVVDVVLVDAASGHEARQSGPSTVRKASTSLLAMASAKACAAASGAGVGLLRE